MKRSFVIKATLILAVLFFGLYIVYVGNLSPDSYIFVYPEESTNKNIQESVLLLKENNYIFIDSKQLKGLVKKKEEIEPRTVSLFINKAPNENLIKFFKTNKIPATFMVKAGQSKMAAKFKNESLGLMLQFEEPEPIRPQDGYVTINLDDGYLSSYTQGLPVLRNASIAPSYYVVAHRTLRGHEDYVNPGQISKLQDEGWEIGSHGYNHEDFKELNKEETIYELSASKGYLEGLGLFIAGFSYPYGENSSNSMLFGQDYFLYQRFVSDNYNFAGSKDVNSKSWRKNLTLKLLEKRLDHAKKEKIGVAFTFHSINEGDTNYAVRPSFFKKIISVIKQSGLPVYSNIALFGKPLFLRQEFGHRLESNKEYEQRMRLAVRQQKNALKNEGIKAAILYYPEGVVTSGLIKAAKLEGMEMAFGKSTGYLDGNLDLFNLKTAPLKKDSIKKLLGL